MDVNYNTITKYTNIDSAATAYSEYMDNVCFQFSEMQQAVQMVIDDTSKTNQEIQRALQEVEGCDITLDSKIIVDGHNFTLDSVLNSVRSYVNDMNQAIDDEMDTVYDGTLTLVDDTGNAVNAQASTFLGKFEDMRKAAIVERAMADAYAYADEASDRLTVFKDTLETYGIQKLNDASGMITSVMDKLKVCPDFRNAISVKLEQLGLDKDEPTIQDVENSQEVAYTGTSSIFAMIPTIDVGSALVTGAHYAKFALNAVGQVLSGLAKGIWPTFLKIGDFIRNAAIDTDDVGVTNAANSSPTFDCFVIEREVKCDISIDSTHFVSKLKRGPLYIDLITGEYIFEYGSTTQGTSETSIIKLWEACSARGDVLCPEYTYGDTVKDFTEKLIYMFNDMNGTTDMPTSSIMGDIKVLTPLWNGTIYEYLYNFISPGASSTVTVKVKFKPKAIPIDTLYLDGLITPSYDGDGYNYDLDKLSQTLDFVASNPATYQINGEGASGQLLDPQVYKAILNGLLLNNAMIQLLINENPDLVEQHSDRIWMPFDISNGDTFDIAGYITNRHFATLLAEAKMGDNEISIPLKFYGFISTFIKAIEQQDENISTAPFIPYNQRMVGWTPSAYYVKTDAELNEYILDKWKTIGKVVLVLAAAGVAVKLFKANKRANYEFQGQEWNVTEAYQKYAQGKINEKELKLATKDFVKAKRKKALLNFLTGGAVSSAKEAVASLVDTSDTQDSVTDVIKLIR